MKCYLQFGAVLTALCEGGLSLAELEADNALLVMDLQMKKMYDPHFPSYVPPQVAALGNGGIAVWAKLLPVLLRKRESMGLLNEVPAGLTAFAQLALKKGHSVWWRGWLKLNACGGLELQ